MKITIIVKSLIPYSDRFENIVLDTVKLIDNAFFQVVKYEYCSKERAQEFANEIIKEGGEGAIYKHLDATWKHGTSTSQFKIKRRFEAELRVLGWDYGDKGKKHEHRMGRIFVGTDDGKVYTAVGMGFSDELRDEDWDKNIGRIVEVDYETVSESKSRKEGRYALYGPAGFVCFRDDKDATDTIKDLLER